MKLYRIEFKQRCIYTDQPTGDLSIEIVEAVNTEHAEAQMLAKGYAILSIMEI